MFIVSLGCAESLNRTTDKQETQHDKVLHKTLSIKQACNNRNAPKIIYELWYETMQNLRQTFVNL